MYMEVCKDLYIMFIKVLYKVLWMDRLVVVGVILKKNEFKVCVIGFVVLISVFVFIFLSNKYVLDC